MAIENNPNFQPYVAACQGKNTSSTGKYNNLAYESCGLFDLRRDGDTNIL